MGIEWDIGKGGSGGSGKIWCLVEVADAIKPDMSYAEFGKRS